MSYKLNWSFDSLETAPGHIKHNYKKIMSSNVEPSKSWPSLTDDVTL